MKLNIAKFLMLTGLLFCSASCAGTSKQGQQEEALPPIHSSPLGIDQPDPERLAQAAINAYRVGDTWKFLSYFGFMNAQTGKYFTPINDEDDPFYDTHITELRPLAQSLFPLMNSKSSTITFGTPSTVRNRPLTVDVPFTVTYDFSKLNEAEKMSVLNEVNTSLRMQGEQPITFEQYAEKVMSLPAEAGHRFIYRKKRWYIDGAQWRPYRIRQNDRH